MKGKSCLLLAACLVCARAAAQEPKFEFGKKEEVKEVEWKASASAGLVATTGNSQTVTLSGSANVSRKAGDDKIALEAALAYARSDIRVFNDANGDMMIGPGEIDRQSSTTAKNWLAKLRYDRFFATVNSAFIAARLGADEPAGKKLYGGGQVGYSRQLYKDAAHEVVGELGYDLTFQTYEVPGLDELWIHSLRAFAGYTGKLTEDTGFLANVEALFNLNSEKAPQGGDISSFEDTRITGKAALTTKIVKGIDFRIAFTLRFDNAPAPLPAFKLPYVAGFFPLADTVDTQTEVALIVNFL